MTDDSVGESTISKADQMKTKKEVPPRKKFPRRVVVQISYNKLDPKEQARLWHTFNYVCWKACRKSGTECLGRADSETSSLWRKVALLRRRRIGGQW